MSANGKIVAFVKINMDESGTPLLQRFLADTIMHLIYFTFRELSVEEQHPSVCQTQMSIIISMKKIQYVISLPTRKRSKAMRFKNMDSVSSSTKDDWEP